MLTTILCSTLLLYSAGAELLLTVTPEFVEPDVTPSFTLRCSLAEDEEENIAALVIYRRSITADSGTTVPQLVAEILGTSQTTPSLVPGFEGLTVQGQISPTEEELETFLEVVWPNPTVSDLGVYSCEATVLSETGGVTTLVETRVTSSNAVADKILATLTVMEERLRVFNQSLRSIYVEIDNITGEIRPAVEVRPVESITEADAIPVQDTPTEEKILTEHTETDETRSQRQYEELTRILDYLEQLKRGFERINYNLESLQSVISSDRVDSEWRTTTVQDPTEPEVILTLFESDNSSYYLFRAENIDTRRAEVVCATKDLFLAEINDESEFLSISNETSPYLDTGAIVLVGGERQSAQDDFLFQHSKELVQFTTPDFQSDVDFPNGTCLALVQSTAGLTFTSVPCSSDDATYKYFLCERGQY